MKYYLDTINSVLVAYNKVNECFVIYNAVKNEWIEGNITFMQFTHDYDYVNITKEEAMQITGGKLPTEEC